MTFLYNDFIVLPRRDGPKITKNLTKTEIESLMVGDSWERSSRGGSIPS